MDYSNRSDSKRRKTLANGKLMDFALFNGILTLAGLFIQLYRSLDKDVSSFHKQSLRRHIRLGIEQNH